MPYERVLSGPEGRLLYGPEFSDEVSSEYVFLGSEIRFEWLRELIRMALETDSNDWELIRMTLETDSNAF